jgi:hypothetical protein
MPRPTRGSIFTAGDGSIGIRWPEDGKRPQKTGFPNKTEARDWFDREVKPRLQRGAPSPNMSFDAFCDVYLERHDGSERTVETQRERLAPARKKFGTWPLRDLEAPPTTSRAGAPSCRPRPPASATLERCASASPRPSAGATCSATRPSRQDATRSLVPRSCCRSLAPRSMRSRSNSDPSTDRSASSRRRRGCARTNGSPASAATSTAPASAPRSSCSAA